jgi:hypothetical protein
MNGSGAKHELICAKCGVALSQAETDINYLGYNFRVELPKCPICGRIFVSEKLAYGRMRELEEMLETK